MTCVRSLPVLVLLGVGIALPSAGSSSARAPVAPAVSSAASAVSAGFYHSCALTRAGGLKCWGSNEWGQLGDGTTTDRHTPVAVSRLRSGVTAVAAGGAFTCALIASGGVKCWGANTYGQLGDNKACGEQCQTPVNVPGLASGVVAISAGGGHACAAMSGGGVKCWGINDFGQLGDGSTTERDTPVDVSGLGSSVVAIAAGGYHTCALTDAGGVTCWGSDGRTTGPHPPLDVSGLTSGVAMVSAGESHTCALTSAGGVKCWGDNFVGQLGDGTETGRYSAPVNVSGLTGDVAGVSAGYEHTCAFTTAGRVKCWGRNSQSQLGDGTRKKRHTPVNVAGPTRGVAAVAGGGAHTCALTTSGGVKCWGGNGYGQLGDDKACGNRCPTPVQVVGFGRAQCVVPRVKGKKLAPAKRAIAKAHCSVGKVTKAYSKRVKKGRVISQKPKPGTTLPAASPVNLKVSKGPHK
jgi:alpha-tubulin suppressor-like RCC1 family protein